jgi:hypothetical protein
MCTGAPPELWAALTSAHDRRNAIERSAALAPTQAEVADPLAQARSLDRLMRKAAGRQAALQLG